MNGIDQAVGHRIRLRRKALGLSQTELAKRVGVKFQQVQKYETGVNRVAASRLWNIAAALRVEITYFFEDLEQNTALMADKLDTGHYTPAPCDITRILQSISAPQRQAIVALIQTLETETTDSATL